MPSIAKTIGLIFVVVNPAALAAQTARSAGIPPVDHGRAPPNGWAGPSGSPSVGHGDSPPNGPSTAFSFPSTQIGGFRAGPMPGSTPRDPHAGLLADGRGTGPALSRRASEVVPAAYYASLSSAEGPPTAGQPVQPSGEKAAGVPLSPPGRQSSLPLPPPGRSDRAKPRPGGGLPSMITVVGSLALVLGIFFLVAWGMRRASPAGGTALPGEVFEVLGRAPMASRQQVHLLRCGNKLILVSVTTAGAETLSEITDPAEVDRLAGLCRQAHPNSATAAFRQVFGQFASGRRKTGLFAASDRDDLRLGHRREALVGADVPANLDGLENRDV